MPIRRFSAADAFATLKANPHGQWPRRDDPNNRFAHFADPSFKPRFKLEPGQRIFTIGSCFARGIERALADRGFDIPTLAYQGDDREWGGDPTGYLNNYVPPAIAPQVRWAFGMDRFDLDKHGAEAARARYVDLQLHTDAWPAPAEFVEKRREVLNEMYRNLATSHVVLVTLGLIEAWFDNRSGLYINRAPPKGASRSDPSRFELHVLDYNDVTASLEELVGLLDQVCPSDYRVILTVSPVPLTATFVDVDVAVANSYSKSVLRAAVEPFVAGREHIEYFPSYESVILTDRLTAFSDDQIHVNGGMVRFNVDRMIRRYVESSRAETVADVIVSAREDRKKGLAGVGFKRLQQAWVDHPEESELAVALAKGYLQAGNGAAAEKLLLAHLEKHEALAARSVLASYYNECGRYDEAALQAEKASERGKAPLRVSLERAVAYYHLGRLEEGLAVLNAIRFAYSSRTAEVVYWKARFCERLGLTAKAEEFYRYVNARDNTPRFKSAFADFLAAQDRWQEVAVLVDQILIASPMDTTALKLRGELHRRGLQVARGGGGRWLASRINAAWWQSSTFLRRAVGAPPLGAAARAGAVHEDE